MNPSPIRNYRQQGASEGSGKKKVIFQDLDPDCMDARRSPAPIHFSGRRACRR